MFHDFPKENRPFFPGTFHVHRPHVEDVPVLRRHKGRLQNVAVRHAAIAWGDEAAVLGTAAGCKHWKKGGTSPWKLVAKWWFHHENGDLAMLGIEAWTMMQHAGILPENHGDPMVIGCGFDHESGEQLGVLTVEKGEQ